MMVRAFSTLRLRVGVLPAGLRCCKRGAEGDADRNSDRHVPDRRADAGTDRNADTGPYPPPLHVRLTDPPFGTTAAAFPQSRHTGGTPRGGSIGPRRLSRHALPRHPELVYLVPKAGHVSATKPQQPEGIIA